MYFIQEDPEVQLLLKVMAQLVLTNEVLYRKHLEQQD